MKTQLLFLHALTPLHAGTGQGVGVIDLPIAREKATGIPILPGSSLKGALKPLSQSQHKDAVFGKEGDDGTSAAQFADARLLLMPVRSLRGTFAYATSPYLIERFLDDAELGGITDAPSLVRPQDNQVALASDVLQAKEDLVVFEDLDLVPTGQNSAREWGNWLASKIFAKAGAQERFKARFCILSDDVMSFLCQSATEVVARVKLKHDVKTVEKGGLWYEESLPAESVLVSLLSAVPLDIHQHNCVKLSAEQVLTTALPVEVAQFGGKAGVGRGLCRLRSFQPAEVSA